MKANTVIKIISFICSFGVLVLFMACPASSQDYCFEEAGAQYGVSPALLRAISKTETNHSLYAINLNKNGTYDYCHMQINSSWATVIGKDLWASLGDPCQCTKVGAWILSGCIEKHGLTWEAVGCYHSKKKNSMRRVQYAWKIYSALVRSANARTTHLSAAAGSGPGAGR